MATPWPRRATWPTPLREHATSLGTFLHDVLEAIERNGSQTVPADLAGDVIRGALTLVLKTQHTPDLDTVRDALAVAQTKAKTNAEQTAQALDQIKGELKNTVDIVQLVAANMRQNASTVEEARAAAKEATQVGKATLEMAREIKNKAPQQQQTNGPTSYAAAAARGLPLAGTYNTQSRRAPIVQTQREVIVNIRDPLTVQALRAMNPRNLKAHVERAIEQSGNENIVGVKIVSSNQLKSGDLSVKAATSTEVEALRQFADDWAARIGHGASIQIPTYGVLAHGIRTSTMNMDRFEDNRSQILQDNRPFIPQAEIRHIGWLTRDATAKTASTITIEFTRPEDANKIIDEGLVWQGECKAATACGFCAQEHDTRDCPAKSDRTIARKCTLCRGEHEAWSRQCPTRKDEMAKAKMAYDTRPQYHFVPEMRGRNVQPEMPTTILRSRSSQNTAPIQPTQPTRSRSQAQRGQKRTNTGTAIDTTDQENALPAGMSSQRPQRTIMPSRRALEAISANVQLTQSNTQHMEIDCETEA
ncbi:hypothetical protein COCSADRAFT_97718 [Bipolaris sorokiniana ND90Pr]|uniref:Gag-like protein n=1 Tax=Cochliobolus sativus (strain ND90Pr / ATCC 201652) TaxID=665912 RepID=M2S0G6_COCSN|nr:uncharacterized protein COCSADRAFT_97718 [Bipolaris sorokiniana ND90Pr]EMD60748.1 hypothetical protein COCSADRAFT_97718 [Bipolaris sorokiniana ND90Pr]